MIKWDFDIDYIDEKGQMRKYTPDFIVQLPYKNYLILEVKGKQNARDIQKWDFMRHWCKAVSGSEDLEQKWSFYVSEDAAGGQVHTIIDKILGHL